MKFNSVDITNISEFITQFQIHLLESPNQPTWFRGQENFEWDLHPRLKRPGIARAESDLINKFKQNATLLIGHPPSTEFGWLFLLQHYSVPTRLLDWSESPLTALWFAVNESSGNTDAALWVLLPAILNQKANYRPQFDGEIPSFDDDYLKNYQPTTLSFEQRTVQLPMAAIAPRNSARIQAQQGVFTVSHRGDEPLNNLPGPQINDHVWKYKIPAAAKETFRKELRILGISKFQLFPELHNIAESL